MSVLTIDSNAETILNSRLRKKLIKMTKINLSRKKLKSLIRRSLRLSSKRAIKKMLKERVLMLPLRKPLMKPN